MSIEMTYKEAVRKHKNLKAVGQTEIWLRDDSERPWEHVTKCESGGSHRMDIDTSVWFEAKCPKTGLLFRWFFEIEPWEANGKGHYQIDTAGCRDVLNRLTGKGREMFRKYLKDCAVKVESKAKDWKAITDRQFNDADTLNLLSQL